MSDVSTAASKVRSPASTSQGRSFLHCAHRGCPAVASGILFFVPQLGHATTFAMGLA